MKKVFPVAFIAILSLTAILYSCKKSISTSEQNNSKTIITKKTRGYISYSDSVLISHYWQIGSLHNQGLDKLLDNIKQTYGSQYNVYSTTNNNAILASIPQMSIGYVNEVLSPSNIDLNFIRGSINTSFNSLIGATQNTQWEYSLNFKSCISILSSLLSCKYITHFLSGNS